MNHVPAEERSWDPAPSENFTGQVWFSPMSREGPLNALGVLFAPGARTDWHTHPEGQVLYCVAGAGWVVNRAGERKRLSPGDVAYEEAGVEHWHGAGAHTFMEHLSLTTGGPTEWLPEKVSDEQYSD